MKNRLLSNNSEYERKEGKDTMRSVKRAACLLTVLVMVFVMLSTAAFAAEDGKVWLKLTETAGGEGAATLIVTDTTVTDGVVTVTYDSDELTYQNVEVTESYVAMYAVNAETPGEVRISWVAPEAYAADGSDLDLIRVNFTGKADEESVALSGSAFDEEGGEVLISDEVEVEQTPGTDETTAATDATEEGTTDATEEGATDGGDSGNADTGDDHLVIAAMAMAMVCAAGMAVLHAAAKREGAR